MTRVALLATEAGACKPAATVEAALPAAGSPEAVGAEDDAV
jgi:hypothetical protein